MDTLSIGDKVRITQGIWKDHTGIISNVLTEDGKVSYMVTTAEKPFGMEFAESMIQLVKGDDNQKYFEDQLNHYQEETFLEMATIKWGFMSIKLAIYGDEGEGHPHFHFYKNLKPEGGIPASARGGGGCICIESANYFVHAAHTEKMDPKEIKALMKFLKEKNRTIPSITNWEYIIAMWNDNNPTLRQIPNNMEIPQYKSDMKTVQMNKK